MSTLAQGRPTLDDVATQAGVSRSTVSKVLTGRHQVADGTRERVTRAATELGYTPARRAGVSGAEHVWVSFDRMTGPYAGEVLDGLLEEALSLDAVVSISAWGVAQGPGPRPSSPAWIRQGLQRGASAFVLVNTPVTTAHLQAARSSGAPLLVIDPATTAPQEAMSVGATNWRGGVQATEHLLGLGHRRVTYLGAPESSTPGAERLAGVRSAVAAAGLPPEAVEVVAGTFDYDDGLGCAPLLTRPDRPTAVFAANDQVALGVLEAARRHGLHVPDDLSVVGFDDSFAALSASPQLTTVHQPLQQMGRLALRAVVGGIRGDTPASAHLELATTLVVRGSSGPC